MSIFARTFVTLLVFLLLIIAALGVTMDPYALFDTPRVDKLNRYKPVVRNHMRLSKAYRANAGDYEALILGSSRTGRGLSCSAIGYNERNCYNASGPAATLLESFRYLQQQTSGQLKTVYLGLDLFTSIDPAMLNSSFVDERLRIELSGEKNQRYYQRWLNDHFAALFSGQAITHSRKVYSSQGRRIVLPFGDGMPEIYADGSWGDDPAPLIKAGGELRGKKQLQRFTHMYDLMDTQFGAFRQRHERLGREPLATVDEHLDALRRIVDFCHQHSVDLRLFINAAHAYHWKIVYQNNRGELFAYWKSAILTIAEDSAANHGVRPFPIFDFSGFNEVSTESIPSVENNYRLMTRFQDIMHFSAATGQRMVATMETDCADIPVGSWGACLARDSMQADQQLQSERYSGYRLSSQSEWAGFEAELAKARLWKKRQRGFLKRAHQGTL